ncbi:RNA polymerase II-associated factor 1 homolog [Paramacrobiotus metropolitanus]|uniref:RNA polymerase II-associated factor 1 homolog n=1 Tax=Paramacrobiotus metropolitanus TaxID=2943436 RepID=UPI002445906E|nr:RNA polymerase II-associated factor 1 homolog [Paramacrobiotus metropolitanus]XP_055335356.1 RNA polymerase II-associated factor 1 homolog [Paramacrobiotus metropolitanus]
MPSHNTNPSRDGRPSRSGTTPAERDDFLCKVKYLNRLPDIPADPKFLAYSVDLSPYVRYVATSLEKEYRRDINCDTDMGMKLNLLTPPPQIRPEVLDEKGRAIDQLLCQDDALSETSAQKPQRMDHGRHVAWLRKTQLILNDFAPNRAEGSGEKYRPVVHHLPAEAVQRTRQKRIDAIQETFDNAIGKPKRHPTKPNLTVVEEIPLLPNFDLVKFPTVIVTFESDPAPSTAHIPHFTPDEVMANAMLRGMTDAQGNQVVAYFLPTEETLQKLDKERSGDDSEEYIYKLHREFSLPVDDRRGRFEEPVFALNLRENAALYTDLDTKVRLIRRMRGSKKSKSRLVVRFRQLTLAELDERKTRMEAFEMGPPEEDEEIRRNVSPIPEREGSEASSADERVQQEDEGPTDEEPETESKANTKQERASRSPSPSSKSSRSSSPASDTEHVDQSSKTATNAELFGSDSEDSS